MSHFTIPYPEYDIANILQDYFKKKEHFSIAIPLSRQQKYYDILLIKGDTKKSVTIQVKSSRTYIGKETDEFQFYSWLNRFEITDNYSDFYFLYLTYPIFNKNFKPTAKWGSKILVFNQEEMASVIDNIKTKSGKPERFFSICFNAENEIVSGQRGFHHLPTPDFSINNLHKKLPEIKKMLL